MADVTIHYSFSEDEYLAIDVHADAEHPDALDDLASRACACFCQTVADLYTVADSKAER